VETLLDAVEKALPISGVVTLRIPHSDGAALALCTSAARAGAPIAGARHAGGRAAGPALAAVAGYRVERVLD